MRKFFSTTVFLSALLFAGASNQSTDIRLTATDLHSVLHNGERLLYFTKEDKTDQIYYKIYDTLYAPADGTQTGEPFWWIPFYLVNDTLCVRESDLSGIPEDADTLIWDLQFDKGRIVMSKPIDTGWKKEGAIVLKEATTSFTPADQQTMRSLSKATKALLLFTGIGLVEGLIGILLLLKLCRKNNVISKRNLKRRTTRVRQYYKLLKKLGAKDIQTAQNRIDELLLDSADLNKFIQDPDQIKQDSRFGKINQLAKDLEDTKRNSVSIQSKYTELQEYCSELMENPSVILQNKDVRQTKLFQIMQDLKTCATDSVAKNQKLDINDIKTTELKAILTPYMESAGRVSQFAQFKPYFMNVIDAIKNSFAELPNHDEKENTRTLLFYLSQFYSTSITFLDTLHHENTVKYICNQSKINSHRANMEPFFEKQATIKDVSKIKDRGIPCDVSQDSNIIKLFTYLKKYQPLDFNLLGNNYQERLQ